MCWGGGAYRRLVCPQFHVTFQVGSCYSSERLSLIRNFQGWWNSVGIRRLWTCVQICPAWKRPLKSCSWLFISWFWVLGLGLWSSPSAEGAQKARAHSIFDAEYSGECPCDAGQVSGPSHELFPVICRNLSPPPWGPWPWEKEINFAVLISHLGLFGLLLTYIK